MKSKNILPSSFDLRTKEMAASAYVDEQTISLAKTLMEAVNNQDIELYDFISDGLQLEIFGNGRLARLVSWKGAPPIVFVFKDKSAATYYDIIFSKLNGKWIATR